MEYDYALLAQMTINPFETYRYISGMIESDYCVMKCTAIPINIIKFDGAIFNVLFHINIYGPFEGVQDETEWMESCDSFKTSTFQCIVVRKTDKCVGETVGKFLSRSA